MYWMMLARDTGLENGSGAGSEIRRKRVRFCGVGSVKGIGGTGGCQGSWYGIYEGKYTVSWR